MSDVVASASRSGQAENHPKRSYGLRPNPVASTVISVSPERPSDEVSSMWQLAFGAAATSKDIV